MKSSPIKRSNPVDIWGKYVCRMAVETDFEVANSKQTETYEGIIIEKKTRKINNRLFRRSMHRILKKRNRRPRSRQKHQNSTRPRFSKRESYIQDQRKYYR